MSYFLNNSKHFIRLAMLNDTQLVFSFQVTDTVYEEEIERDNMSLEIKLNLVCVTAGSFVDYITVWQRSLQYQT